VASGKRRTTVQSLQRGLEILVAVAQEDRPLGITELSRRFGLAKGSISRLVSTLVEQSFLTQDPETAKYRLSMKVWELGNGAVSRLDIRDVARPAMEALNAATHETVHLTVLTERDEMVFLDKLDSTRSVRPTVEVGAVLPAYCVANGKAMLAFLPKMRVDRILRGKLRQFTDTTVTRKSDLLAQCDEIRRQGYAVNRGEYRADVWGVAAPIRDHTGVAVAALGISVPSQRMTEDLIAELVRRLTKSARRISQALGHRGDGGSPGGPDERPEDRRAGRGATVPSRAGNARAARPHRGAA
jgi:IclR family KDG regulon transcriptional repressor